MSPEEYLEIKMGTYRAMANNLIVKSTGKTLTKEETLFKETALATFREDLRIHMMLLDHNRRNLERGIADGTFDEATRGSPPEGASSKEP